jgi:hypothetical protein
MMTSYTREYNTFPSFGVEEASDFFKKRKQVIKQVIESNGKEYILGVDVGEYIQHLVEEYSLEPLTIDVASSAVQKPQITKDTKKDHWGDPHEVLVYNIEVRYNFTGDVELFRLRPGHRMLISKDINVNESESTVSYSIKMWQQDPAEFQRLKAEYERNGFGNHVNLNQEVDVYNRTLSSWVTTTFNDIKEGYKKENDFFAAISVKENPERAAVFSVPITRKKVFKKPQLPKDQEFSTSPTIPKHVYQSILKSIYSAGKAMEKKPSLYKNKDEEGLRDVFIFHLESHYDGLSTTAETFNRGGKTDILIKHVDGTNVFVAECKVWKGASEFLAGINQLFERYLTWRDSQAAVMFFVPNKNFSGVLQSAKVEIKKHPLFVKETGSNGESSFSYQFKLSEEDDRKVALEAIFFHFDKL